MMMVKDSKHGIVCCVIMYAVNVQAAPAAVDMFDCDGVTTTVTTISLHPDDEL